MDANYWAGARVGNRPYSGAEGRMWLSGWLACTATAPLDGRICAEATSPWSDAPPLLADVCAPDGPPTFIDTPLGTGANSRTFDIGTSRPGDVVVTCTLGSDPEEVHRVTGADRCRHVLTIHGMLADEAYDCVLEADGHVGTRRIETSPLPDDLPTWTTVVGPAAGDDYTLLTHGTGVGRGRTTLLVVDREGRVRWSWRMPWEASGVDVSYLGADRILLGGTKQGAPTVVGLSGTVLAQAPPSSTGLPYHHHAERVGCGEIATLTETTHRSGGTPWTGFGIDLLDPPMIAPVWTWSSQQGLDDGWLVPPDDGEKDPWHANALQLDAEHVYVNLYESGLLVKLDRDTGEHVWSLGAGGDFALRDQTGAPSTDWFAHAHAPEKDGERLLVYDNGLAGASRLQELLLDEAAREATVVWTYTEPDWFEPIWGDVDRLVDGTVLFVRAHCDGCRGAIPDARTEVVVVDPATDTVVWRLSFAEPGDTGYRAEHVDPCTIFANRRYCPEG